MEKLTDDLINKLIQCPKQVVEPPKREMKAERGNKRNGMRLHSVDDQLDFSVFVRVNERFLENFSVGLRYHPKEGPSCLLLRCNGPHGPQRDLGNYSHEHFDFHVHKAKAQCDDSTNAELIAERTDGYGSCEQAIQYMLRSVNVVDADKYVRIQLPLFTDDED